MKLYCGLDISLKFTAVCVVDQDGTIVREGEVPTEPVAIHEWLTKLDRPMERIGLEAGGLSPWLCHELLSRGYAVICLETRHAKAALKAQPVKTDRNDARGLAQIVRTGWYREVHVKSQDSQKLRLLLANRKCLLRKRLDIESQIRGTLKVFGLKTGQVSVGKYEARISQLVAQDVQLHAFVIPMLVCRRELLHQCNRLEKLILSYVIKDEVCRRWMAIPGVGYLTALVFKTYVDRPQRFRQSKTVGAAVGLTPRKYASGDVDYDGRMTKCGDAFVRTHLFEAAKVMLTRTKCPSALRSWGLQVAQRSSMKNACGAVARRLAVIMHAMWKDGTDFRFSTPEITPATKQT